LGHNGSLAKPWDRVAPLAMEEDLEFDQIVENGFGFEPGLENGEKYEIEDTKEKNSNTKLLNGIQNKQEPAKEITVSFECSYCLQ
jgi:hypothetical protein